MPQSFANLRSERLVKRPNGRIVAVMNTSTATFESVIVDAAAEQCSSLLEVAGLSGIPYTELVHKLETPNLFTIQQIATLGLVLGIRVPELVLVAI